MNIEQRAKLATQFFDELTTSFETLGGIADQYGVRTLTDLMYLHASILSVDGFIDTYSDESSVREVLAQLPSEMTWAKYVRVYNPTRG